MAAAAVVVAAASCNKQPQTPVNPSEQAAYEEFNREYTTICEEYTQVCNVTINNPAYQGEDFAAARETATVALSGVQQNLDNLSHWAEESYQKGTLANDLDEILNEISKKGGIQEQLTQILNRFSYDIADVDAMAAFMLEYEVACASVTQVYNVTVNNPDYQGEDYEFARNNAAMFLSGISQNLETLLQWATEANDQGKLSQEINEILGNITKDGGIQDQLTQVLNAFDYNVTEVKSMYEVMEAYNNILAQYTQVYNSTVNNPEYQGEDYEYARTDAAMYLSGIQQNIEDQIYNYAMEAYEAGNLQEVVNDILGSITKDGGFQDQLTQVINRFQFNVNEVAAMNEFIEAYNGLMAQYTQVYNTVNSPEYAAAKYDEIKEQVLAILSGIAQNLEDFQTEAMECYEAGTMQESLEGLLNNIYKTGGYQEQISSAYNLFMDTVAEIK